MPPIPGSGAASSRRSEWSAITTLAFMSPTPGPVRTVPSLRNGQPAAVPAGQTVSAWPSTSSRRPSPNTRRAVSWSARPGNGVRSTSKPLPARCPANSSITACTPSVQ